MRFFGLILLFFIMPVTLFGYIGNRDDYNAKMRVLKELDIDPQYMRDPYFLSMITSSADKTRKNFVITSKEGYKYVAMLKELINESNMPKSFLYLAMVESGLSNNVVSNAKAAGMWQFMESTGRLYGLRIDKYVDERRDPIASTMAAMSYLKTLKTVFGKWYLALMAYNAGEGKVKRAIKKAGTDDLNVLIDPNKQYLPLETRMFIRKILVAANMFEDSDFIISNGSSMLNNANGVSIVRESVPGGTTLAEIGDSIGLSVKKMKEYNAHLRYFFTPPNSKFYHVYIPINKQELFASNFKPNKNDRIFHVYKVKKGDTLAKIAIKWGVQTKVIQKYNNIKTLKPNNYVVIATSKNTPILASYKIQKGDTLIRISKKFNVEVAELIRINNMKNTKLAIGDDIVIPK